LPLTTPRGRGILRPIKIISIPYPFVANWKIIHRLKLTVS
jgi:hypothetical protein